MAFKMSESEPVGAVPAVHDSLHNEDLAPTTPEQRTWTTYNYAALWIGMAHCIPTYMMASGLIDQGFSWGQAIFTILLANTIVLLPMLLISYIGTRYGLPFPVICRASFGTLGANLPAILRALVACGWFGIQTWIGGEALHNLLGSLWPGLLEVSWAKGACFMVFWVLNIWLIWKGMDMVRWFEGWAAPAVLVVTLLLLIYMVRRAGGFGPILATHGDFKSTAEFLRILPGNLMGLIGFWATMALNMPDFTRYAKDQKAQIVGQIVGLPPTMTIFSAMGVIITAATTVVYGKAIADPLQLLAKPEFANPIIVLISLISIAVATLSVNVAANVVSPAFDFANLWPSKINFRIGGTITGVIGIMMCPWYLLANTQSYIFVWLNGYSIVLGPIAGIMICDYWLLRRKHLTVSQLYLKEGMYGYSKGWNWCAVAALVLAALPNVPGFLMALDKVADDTIFATIYSFSWLVGFLLGGILYGVFMTLFGKEQLVQEHQAAMEGA